MAFRGKNKSMRDFDDAQFDAFLKASVSSEESTIDTARINQFLEGKKKGNGKPLWMVDEDDDDIGLSGTGKNFLKKVSDGTPEPTVRKNKFLNHKVLTSGTLDNDVGISKDSLDDVSLRGKSDEGHKSGLGVPALNLGSSQSFTDTMTGDATMGKTGIGMDTLDEIRDKEKFFKELEKNSDSTLDFSQLNKDLDGSATLAATAHNKRAAQPFLQYQRGGQEDSEEEDHEESEDEEDELGPGARSNKVETKESGNDSVDQNKAGLLSKVALMDSLDSTLGTKHGSQDPEARSQDMKTIPEGTEGREERANHDLMDGHSMSDTKEESEEESEEQELGHRDVGKESSERRGLTLKTGTGFGFTDTSHEIEALQKALQQAGMSTLDDSTRDFTMQNSESVTGTNRLPDGSSSGVPTKSGSGFGLKPLAPAGTDKPQRTVDDIIREVEEFKRQDDEVDSRGFSLQPSQGPLESNTDLETREFDIGANEEDGRGFDLSPVHTQSGYGDTRQSLDLTSQGEQAPEHSQLFDSHPRPAPRRARKDDSRSYQSPSTKRERSRDRFSHVQSSGYGVKTPPKSKSSTSAKNAWSPADTLKQKIKGTQSPVKKKGNKFEVGGSVSDGHLFASVHSFANYIQSHFTEDSVRSSAQPQWSEDVPALSSSQRLSGLEREKALVKEVQDWQEQWKNERKLHMKKQAELDSLDREYQRKLQSVKTDFEQQIFKHKQENFILAAKVSEGESGTKQKLLEIAEAGGASAEQMALLEKEVREQEGLLAGYQQENERLYQEMKKMQQLSKGAEQRMFRENQKLANDLVNLRAELEQKDLQLKNKGLITGPFAQQEIAAGNLSSAVLGAGRIAQLEAELKHAKVKEFQLERDVELLKKSKEELDRHIELQVKKLEECGLQLDGAQQSQNQEAKEVQQKFEKEIEKLNRKLRWYAENQEILDKDIELLKMKDAEIKDLNAQIEHLTSETGRKHAELRTRAKERSGDAKRIQDLERQVKEMENVIRKRHPNSLPVLMWAASTAPDPSGKKAPSVEFLEKCIKKLEGELEAKDEEAKLGLRALEQKYNAMKFQYEERIKDLEDQIMHLQRPNDRHLREGEHPHTHTVALQRELEGVKDRYKKRVAELEGESEMLKKEIIQLKAKAAATSKAEEKAIRENDSIAQQKVKALQEELANQDQHQQMLQRHVERLQKEKQQLVVEMTRNASRNQKPTERHKEKPSKGKVKGLRKASSTQDVSSASDRSSLPAYPPSTPAHRSYQADTFTGQHISDVLRENEELRLRLDRIQLEQAQERVHMQKLLAETEARERRAREEADEKVSLLRGSHQAEIQRLLADQALRHSTSSVTELQAKVDTQEVVISHLKEQIALGQVVSEQLSASRIREAALETQVQQLLDELREAKKSHTPQMRHFEALQEKIKQLENRHAHREQELKQIIQNSRSVAMVEIQTETEKWRQIVDSKNREIERFRTELDAILDVLKQLQRQGVVLPSSSRHPSFR